MKTIAIIPARGGSKAIPKKNLIEIASKPLIAWSILAAKCSKGIDEVYVTSDSHEILEVAKLYGAKTILRPDEISGDRASSESAITHAIEYLASNQLFPEVIIMLQATSPLRKKNDLDNALHIFSSENLDSLFSSAKLLDFLIWEQNSEGILQSINYDWRNRGRRQERAQQIVENGSFYIFKTKGFQEFDNRFFGRIGVSHQEFWQSFELDEPEDLALIKTLFNTYNVEKEFI